VSGWFGLAREDALGVALLGVIVGFYVAFMWSLSEANGYITGAIFGAAVLGVVVLMGIDARAEKRRARSAPVRGR
jgi:hypothetical protein